MGDDHQGTALGLNAARLSVARALACGGDDDDDGGGGGCANAQMLCKDSMDVKIDCDEFDSAPASVKDCAGKATTCDAVTACVLAGAGG